MATSSKRRRAPRTPRTSAQSEADLVGYSLRMKERLRRQLEQSAAERGTSLNAEICRRLDLSFEQSGLFGGGAALALARALGAAMAAAGQAEAEALGVASWLHHPAAYDRAAAAARVLLGVMRPGSAVVDQPVPAGQAQVADEEVSAAVGAVVTRALVGQLHSDKESD
jgi:Arc-like DNA binding domain